MGVNLSTENLTSVTEILEPIPQESLCLKMPLILRKIFQHFSNNQLLRLSLVSKLWHSEARNLMAERGGLMPRKKPNLLRRKELAIDILASDLKKMDAALISLCGISMKLGYSECFLSEMPWSKSKLQPRYVVILDRLKWRNLSVTFSPKWDSRKYSQGFLFLKSILEKKCEDLVEISLTMGTNLGEPFIQEFLQGQNFSSLKTLKLETRFDGKTELNFVKVFLSLAPKLQTVHVPPSFLVSNIFKGSSVVVVPKGGLNPCHNFPGKLLGQIRLHSIRIGLRKNSSDFNVQTFNRIMPVLLGNSCTTLNIITIDLLLVVPLMNYGISFVNVRDLGIGVKNDFFSSYDPALLEYVKAFHFTRIFPNVNKVHVANFVGHHISADDFREFTKQGNAALKKPDPGRAVKIKHLRYQGPFEADQIRFFAQMFPDVETLLVRPYQEAGIPYVLIWEHWVNLKEFYVNEPHFILSRNQILNMDSVFCGIFPEEVAELRKESKEYLEAVNIVPVMPSITSLKELRTFGLDYTTFICFGSEEIDTFAFSKVTEMIAFARCPYLSVFVHPSKLCERRHSEVSPSGDAVEWRIYNSDSNFIWNSCPFRLGYFFSF